MKKTPLKGVICFSLSTLFLIVSCKKTDQVTVATNSQLAIASSQSNSDLKNPVISKQSGLFAYLNTIPYEKALDTLHRYILANEIKTNLSGTALSGKIGSVMSLDPVNATPEQMLASSSLGGTTEIDANDGQASQNKLIEKTVDWIVIQHFLNWWRVESTETLVIQLGSGLAAGSYSPYFNFMIHAGSRVQTELPFNPVNWNENLNEHFPTQFGIGVQEVVSRVGGTVSAFGLSVNKEGLHIFHVSDFIPI